MYSADNNIIGDDKIGILTLVGSRTDNLPMWSINHYITETCNNYNKFSIIRKVCELIHFGARGSQLMVCRTQAEIFPNELVREEYKYNERYYFDLSGEKRHQSLFWRTICELDRPIVLFYDGYNYLPLMDYDYKDSVKIISLKYNSPPQIDIQGGINGLIDIVYARKRMDMEVDEHIARQIEQSVKNVKGICLASQAVENEKTPDGVKLYAQRELEYLMLKQSELNARLGIRAERLDKRV